MQRATHPGEEQAKAHPAPVPRDPDLPQVSDGTLRLFAAAALIAAVAALLVLAR
jgi:hypothetical protein